MVNMCAKAYIKEGPVKYEIDSWLRMLDYQQQEIVSMKNRIAEVVKGQVASDSLLQLEEFQNLFINKETVITFFRADIQRLNDKLNNNNSTTAEIDSMRHDITKMEQEFLNMKAHYHRLIAGIS